MCIVVGHKELVNSGATTHRLVFTHSLFFLLYLKLRTLILELKLIWIIKGKLNKEQGYKWELGPLKKVYELPYDQVCG